jgi:thioredoxin-dependent peroxiredoxin
MNLFLIARIGMLCVVCAGMALSAAGGEAVALPEVGQKAPHVSLPSQDGTRVSLSDFHGKWVVLYFYPKDNTPGCTIEAHNFQRDLPKYEEKHAVILGVSVDSAESHQDFCTKQSLTFKLLADTEKKVTTEYGSLRENGMAQRNTFLIDPHGKIAKVWTGVKPQEHSDEILATLAELQKN